MFSKHKLLVPFKLFINVCKYSHKAPQALRPKKAKSISNRVQHFIDLKPIRTIGGKGGDGCISFLHLWANANAGPDGGDGGNGGHIIFRANGDVKDLIHVYSVIRGQDGEKGRNKNCNGKNAEHTVIDVPVGTIIKAKPSNKVIGDLSDEGVMFLAAKGGAGGKGNHYFVTQTSQAPEISEYGALGEDRQYVLEIKTMANIGLIGFPNAGKSTLMHAITRAKPKIAPYPFTTLKPHVGMIQFDDYEQVAVADLPGIIQDSHKNRGLGIQFLKHAERCSILAYVLDMSHPNPWDHLYILQHEISKFSSPLLERPQFIIANKMDLPDADKHLEKLKNETDLKVVGISARLGYNLAELLTEIRLFYDINKEIK